MSNGVKDGIWIQILLNELLPEQTIKKMKIFDNNKMSLILTRDPESQNHTEHINLMYHHVQRLVEDRELGIK